MLSQLRHSAGNVAAAAAAAAVVVVVVVVVVGEGRERERESQPSAPILFMCDSAEPRTILEGHRCGHRL